MKKFASGIFHSLHIAFRWVEKQDKSADKLAPVAEAAVTGIETAAGVSAGTVTKSQQIMSTAMTMLDHVAAAATSTDPAVQNSLTNVLGDETAVSAIKSLVEEFGPDFKSLLVELQASKPSGNAPAATAMTLPIQPVPAAALPHAG